MRHTTFAHGKWLWLRLRLTVKVTGKIRGDCVQKGMLYLAEKTAGIATHSAISPAQAGKVWKPHSFDRGVEVATKPFPCQVWRRGVQPVRGLRRWNGTTIRRSPAQPSYQVAFRFYFRKKKRRNIQNGTRKIFRWSSFHLPLSAPHPATALPYSVRGSKGWVRKRLPG